MRHLEEKLQITNYKMLFILDTKMSSVLKNNLISSPDSGVDSSICNVYLIVTYVGNVSV